MTNFIDEGEEEVLNGVSKLREELEIERLKNNGLAQQVECMKMKQSINEDDEHTQLRMKIVDLENQLASYIGKSNSKRGGEEAMLSRLRTLLEKSEASRHQAEYNLVLEKKTNREIEERYAEKEHMSQAEITQYKGTLSELQCRAREWESAVELTQKAADMEKDNMGMVNKKLKTQLEEKDSVIQFMNYDCEQHKKAIEQLMADLDAGNSAQEKTKKSFDQQQVIISKQKDMLKQLTLKDAVREQKEIKNKEDIRLKREEIKELKQVIESERQYNIQSNHNISRLQEKMGLQHTQVTLVKDKLAEASNNITNLNDELDDAKRSLLDGEDRENQLTFEIDEIKKASTISEQLLNDQLKDQQHHITDLTTDLKHHQNICTELSNELGLLQNGMEQIESQYSQSVLELERVYCQHYKIEKNNMPAPLYMVNTLAQRLMDNQNIENKLESEVEGLKREIERSKYSANLQRDAMTTKTEAIASLNKQVSEITGQLQDSQEDLKLSHSTVNTLQQQITDLSLLLGTEQEKVMALLKDKKDAINESHNNHKHKCEALQGILSVLGDPDNAELGWSELCRSVLAGTHAVIEEKSAVTQSLQNAREEVMQCHKAMETLSNNIDTLRAECAKRQADGDEAHTQHIKALEGHYQTMIDTLNGRVKATEEITINTNNKLATMYTENETLQDNINTLKEECCSTRHKLERLNNTIGLLATSLFTKTQDYNSLTFRYSLLKRQCTLNSVERSEIRALSSALVDEQPRQNLISKFRIAGIAVLAANRLRAFGKNRSTKPTLDNDKVQLLLNCDGLTTEKLMRILHNCGSTTPCYEGSLLQQIARTLKYSENKPIHKIRAFVLALTQRLHSSELERRSLSGKAAHWECEANELKGAYMETLELGKKVQELEGKAFNTVPLGKHEEVMRELASVMGREDNLREEAHNLRQQLKRLEESYEHTTMLLQEKGNTLDEAIKELAQHKVQSRQIEQNHRATTRRAANLENDKKTILDQLQTVQKCVESRTRDRDILLNYLTKLEKLLEEKKCQISYGEIHNDIRVCQENDEHTAEINQIQKICQLYEDIFRLSKRRILCLERDVESFRDHTVSLKGELNAACQRLVVNEIPQGKTLVGDNDNQESNETFVQLVPCDASELGARVGKNFADVIDKVSWS